jgi:hypothetical protein
MRLDLGKDPDPGTGNHTRLANGSLQNDRLSRHCDVQQTGNQDGCFRTATE